MMIPVMSIAGRLGIGWVSDIISRRVLWMLAVVGQIIGTVLFIYAHLSVLLIPFVIFFGVSYGGSIVLRTGILRDYYGIAHIGSLIGLLMGLTQIGSIVGPLFAGRVFDTTGNYSIAWVVSGVVLLLSIPLILIMKHPQTTGKTVDSR